MRHNDVMLTSRIWKIACFVNILFSLQEYFATSNFYWKRMYNGLMRFEVCYKLLKMHYCGSSLIKKVLILYPGCQRYGSLLSALNLPCCENWEWAVARSYLWPRTWGLLNMPNQSEEVLNRQSQILTLQVDWLDEFK